MVKDKVSIKNLFGKQQPEKLIKPKTASFLILKIHNISLHSDHAVSLEVML